MHVLKHTLASSPYVGLFGLLTDEMFLAPPHLRASEEKELKEFFSPFSWIPATIASTPLLGVLAVGLGRKIAVGDLLEAREVAHLEKESIEVLQVEGLSAIGNLVAVCEKGGIASPSVSEPELGTLQEFFRVPFFRLRIGKSDLSGSNLVLTGKGYVACPQLSPEEAKSLQSSLNLPGRPTTLNYGDRFVHHSLVANKTHALIGEHTTPHELVRVEDALF